MLKLIYFFKFKNRAYWWYIKKKTDAKYRISAAGSSDHTPPSNRTGPPPTSQEKGRWPTLVCKFVSKIELRKAPTPNFQTPLRRQIPPKTQRPEGDTAHVNVIVPSPSPFQPLLLLLVFVVDFSFLGVRKRYVEF